MGKRRTMIEHGAAFDVLADRLTDAEVEVAHNTRLLQVIVEELQLLAWERARGAAHDDTAVRFLAGTVAIQAEHEGSGLVPVGGLA